MRTASATVDDEIATISDRADDFGVEIEVDLDSHGFIWIGQITRRNGIAGSGRRVIEMVFEIADQVGYDVRLACLEWNGDLLAYYEGLGFEIDHDATAGRREDDDHVVMVRSPE